MTTPFPFAGVKTTHTAYNLHRNATYHVLNCNITTLGFKPKLYGIDPPISVKFK